MTNAGGSLARPRHSWWREGAIVATAFVLCAAGGGLRVNDTVTWPPAAAYVIAAVSGAALLLRHRAPVLTLASTTACGMLVAPLDLLQTPLIVAPAVISSYVLAVRLDRRVTAAALATSAALLVASTALFGNLSWQDGSRLAVVAAFPLVAGVLGHSTQNRRAYLAAVEERAHRAEESRDSEAQRRVAEERLRIARELHDVVAHQITLASAQATVAAHLFDTRPEQTRKNLDQLIETTGNALDDLRATVGLLRQDDDTTEPVEPAPGLSRLPTLLESFGRAGLDVALHEEGDARALPPGVDLTAYRIIQEALTNVTKHAGTGTARVALAWSRDRMRITIDDDGTTAAAAPGRAPGYGLMGMRERATAVGGTLSAGRRADGGFRVSAELPLPPVKESSRADAGEAGDDR